MLTDQQALQLIESMRRNTQNTDVAALCDWITALVQRAATGVAPKPDRRAYMREYMQRRRAEKK
jgi:hypothetical protein